MTRIQVEFDTDVFAAVRKSPAEVAREMRIAVAIVWYAQGIVSQGKAAELAGLSRAEFLDMLSASRVAACQETIDDNQEALSHE